MRRTFLHLDAASETELGRSLATVRRVAEDAGVVFRDVQPAEIADIKRKDGRWVAVQTLGFDAEGRQLRRHFYGSSKNEVGRRLEDALRARRTGMAPPDERRTVARQLSDWLEGLRPTVRPSSFVRYEGDVRRWIVPAIGNIPLARLAPADVRRLLASCAGAGLSARSISHVHATLRTAVGAAVRDGLVVRNVPALVSAPPAPKPRVRAIGQTMPGRSSRRWRAIASGRS